MGSILDKKVIASILCLTIFFSNFVFFSEALGQTAPPSDSAGEYYDFESLGGTSGSESSTDTSGTYSDTSSYISPGQYYDFSSGLDDPINNGSGSGNSTSSNYGVPADSGTLLPTIDGYTPSPSNPGDGSSAGAGPGYTTAGPSYQTQYDVSRGQSGTKSANTGTSSSTSNFASCAIGASLGSQISAAIKAGSNSILAKIGTRYAKHKVSSTVKVPVFDRAIQEENSEQNKKLGSLQNKETGPSFFGITLPSLDSIGYCLINTMIVYISESTIRWINSGFKGNPAFIENFDQFFKDLASREISMFLGQIASTDLICGPLRVDVQKNLLNSHGSRYALTNSSGRISGAGKCTFGKAGNASQGIDLATYTAGEQSTVIKGGWGTYSQAFKPQNNVYSATILAKHEAERRIEQRQELTIKETLEVNGGTLSGKDSKGNVYSPGSTINKQLQKRLEIPNDRLVLADEFDEIVTALVNQLVKIALDETLGKLNKSLKDAQSDLNSSNR